MLKINKLFSNLLVIFLLFNSLYSQIPLFKYYPELNNKLSHVTLGQYPTSIINAQNLAKNLNIKNLYIKDDGYIDSRNIPTGNKMRKLEFLLADAINKNYKTICTVGGAGSNHALETLVLAKSLGLDVVLMLDDQLSTSSVIRNLKLMVNYGAKILYIDPIYDTSEKIENYVKDFCDKNNYYFIPVGGSNEIGCMGFVNAAFELKEQLKVLNMQEPDIIYVTLGSAGTAAGLIVGAKLAGLKSKIIPVRISMTPEYKSNILCELINKINIYIKNLGNNFIITQASVENNQVKYLDLDIEIKHDFAGPEYAFITQQAASAVNLLNNFENIKLESTYTGKTLAALVNDANNNLLKDKNVLFWNTFSHDNFDKLTNNVTEDMLNSCIPVQMQHYLTDKLQELDPGL
ncbi:MAG: 1-aminocyclopropane-1-carboxylate deaminase [candidate division TM6 bacterium GW2011_GWF2_28_16]|nr:MAG: 1-aminocyclopropane-1-carboxylate deaminase [candidate division TM6 bacterium GW2011_GWF2_28_16]